MAFLCIQGCHRSVVGAVLMFIAGGYSIDDAFAHVHSVRPLADMEIDDGNHTPFRQVPGRALKR